MHRFHLPPDQCQGRTLELRHDEAHHALHVLRLRPGEQVMVLDGAGHRLVCEVRTASRHTVELAVMQREFVPPLPYRLTLLQAVPKSKALDTIVQKATELGVWRIVPLLTERVVTRLDDARASGKREHWRRTALEAIKQCGSAWLPQIEPSLSLPDYLSREEGSELSLVASLRSGAGHPRAAFDIFRAQHHRWPRSVSVWVGPEGDFTATELNAIQSSGAHPITLGRHVLRADTAAIYCLSVLSYELQTAAD